MVKLLLKYFVLPPVSTLVFYGTKKGKDLCELVRDILEVKAEGSIF